MVKFDLCRCYLVTAQTIDPRSLPIQTNPNRMKRETQMKPTSDIQWEFFELETDQCAKVEQVAQAVASKGNLASPESYQKLLLWVRGRV